MSYTEKDIDRDLAIRAFAHTSHWPEERADRIIKEYVENMAEFATLFGDDHDGFEQYRQGYLDRLNAYLAAHSRCASAFIVGPSNFPTRTMEKRNATADKRVQEFLDYITKTRKRLTTPKKADRGIAEVEAEIAKCEKLQAVMKAANAIIRKKIGDDEKRAALVGLGLSEKQAAELLLPDFAGRLGFASFQLTNNNATIKRLRERLAELQKREAAEDTQTLLDGLRLVEDTVADRIQLIFDGKPEQAIIDALKARGFRWAPSIKAWQRQLTDNARRAAREVVEVWKGM